LASAAQAKPTIEPGTSVTVTVSSGPGNKGGWIGLFRVGAPADGFSTLAWGYLNGTQVAPSAGTSSATFSFVMPSKLSSLSAGLYEFAFSPKTTSRRR
jgi:hypothetical protein